MNTEVHYNDFIAHFQNKSTFLIEISNYPIPYRELFFSNLASHLLVPLRGLSQLGAGCLFGCPNPSKAPLRTT